ncbi:MAG: transglycosylase SLT domain-containing protein, partial [Thermales bacterium]|nr:transglycosylase SLT domain-containing protein [Thermales bacterium]
MRKQKKKIAQEKAKQEQKERENQAKLAEQRKATAAAAAQTVKIQANPSVSIPSSGIRNEAYNFIKSLGYSDGDWSQIDFIVNKESTWNPNAVNRVSGACGLAQALPCNNSKFGVHTDYKTNWQSQLKWLLDYSNNRYGSISS